MFFAEIQIEIYPMLFLAAVLSGFVASAPVGPVNLWIAQALIAKQKSQVWWFSMGVILVDLAYIFLGFWTYFFVSDKSVLNLSVGWHIFTGLVIMIVGLISLLKNQQKIQTNTFQKTSQAVPLRAFLTGLILCASNSMLFVLWLFIAGIFDSYGLQIQNYVQLSLVIFGTLIGDVLWFYGIVYFAEKRLTRIKPIHATQIQKIIAISLVLFGLFTACRQL